MAFFEDLSPYEYARGTFSVPGTLNVGWLSGERSFPTAKPRPETLEALWRYCHVSVAQTRGLHRCDVCSDAETRVQANVGRHGGERLLLGSSELRVFGSGGVIYAAPTMIFHYVVVHDYAPPDAFVEALVNGVGPPDPAYYARLAACGLEWRKTSRGPEVLRPFRLGDPNRRKSQ